MLRSKTNALYTFCYLIPPEVFKVGIIIKLLVLVRKPKLREINILLRVHSWGMKNLGFDLRAVLNIAKSTQ